MFEQPNSSTFERTDGTLESQRHPVEKCSRAQCKAESRSTLLLARLEVNVETLAESRRELFETQLRYGC